MGPSTMRRVGCVLALVAAVGAGAAIGAQTVERPSEGFPMPRLEVEAVDLAGHRWSTEALRGHVVVVMFLDLGADSTVREVVRRRTSSMTLVWTSSPSRAHRRSRRLGG